MHLNLMTSVVAHSNCMCNVPPSVYIVLRFEPLSKAASRFDHVRRFPRE
jgi:hypothetical protein